MTGPVCVKYIMTILENIVKVFPRTIISNHIEKKVFVLDNNKTPDQNNTTQGNLMVFI